MPDKDPIQEPKNDEGRKKKNLTPEQQTVLDEVRQELREIRGSFETRVEAATRELRDETAAKLTALRETLAEARVQEGLDKITDFETHLAALPVEGDESFPDRLSAVEASVQQLAKGPGGAGGPAGKTDLRAQVMETLADQIAFNPQLGDMIRHDPALSTEYLNALTVYLTRGRGALHGDRAKLAAQANDFGERVLNKPKDVRTAGGVEAVMNTLTSDFDPGLGMRVPAPLAARIVRKAFELSPLLADSGRTSTAAAIYPYLRDTGWEPDVAERGEREDVLEDDENDELFQEEQIDVHEEQVTTRLTLVMIEDGVDVISEYETRTARVLGKKASFKVHFGTGTKMPLGLQRDPAVAKVLTGSADSLPFRALLHASLDLDPEYEAGARYYLSKGGTKAAVLATNSVGDYIWQPSQQDGSPSLLHGYAWRRDPYLTNETAVTETGVTFATGAHPALFGNVGVGCLYVERLGLQVQIDDVTKKGWRKYWSRRRWGWGVVDPAALRLVEVGTS